MAQKFHATAKPPIPQVLPDKAGHDFLTTVFYDDPVSLGGVDSKVVSPSYVILESRDLHHWLALVSPVSERC